MRVRYGASDYELRVWHACGFLYPVVMPVSETPKPRSPRSRTLTTSQNPTKKSLFEPLPCRLLLSLNPSGARQMGLDEVYPVEGLKTPAPRGAFQGVAIGGGGLNPKP